MSKIVFITGAGSGLGFEIASLFYEQGWQIFATATTADSANKIQQAIPTATVVLCNLHQLSDIENAVNVCIQKFGAIHVLINNAAIPAKGELLEQSPQHVSDVMQVNVTGAIWLTMQVLPHMKRQSEARIINISSTVGKTYIKNASVYVASKHALTGFSKSLMDELLDTHISVCTIYPGGMETPMHKSPRPQYLHPRQVAESVYFVASRPNDVLISELVITSKAEKRIP